MLVPVLLALVRLEHVGDVPDGFVGRGVRRIRRFVRGPDDARRTAVTAGLCEGRRSSQSQKTYDQRSHCILPLCFPVGRLQWVPRAVNIGTMKRTSGSFKRTCNIVVAAHLGAAIARQRLNAIADVQQP